MLAGSAKKAATVLGAATGLVGLSALAGLLITVMVAPIIAVTGVTATSTIHVFEALPEYITLGQQKQKNEIRIAKPGGGTMRIATIYDQNREEVPLEKMSQFLKDAAISGEDRRFYDHGGVDPNSVVRAAVGAAGGSDAGGASTLTMQTVRNILVLEAFNDETLTPEESLLAQREALEPTAGRKLKEMKLAIGLEKNYSKDEILAGYLNIANFGGNTYGVEAAANQYFSRPAAKLNAAQAASLIAIVQNPSIRSLHHPDNFVRNQERRDFILGRMFEDGKLTQEQYDQAIATPVDKKFLKLSDPSNGCFAAVKNYAWFCDYVTHTIKDLPALGATPEERLHNWKYGGYTLYGSLDATAQKFARQTVTGLANPAAATFELGAALATVEVGTGRILVMTQNKDFDNRSKAAPHTTAVNYTADKAYGGSVGFQPGSTYKPYTLLAWLDAGRGVEESFDAGITSLNQAEFADRCNGPWGGSYPFRNDSGEKGHYTARRGTAESINSVFLQMATELDQCDIRDIARDIGVHRANGKRNGADLYTMPSCVIGGCDNTVSPLTQAAAYAAIAGEGVYCRPIAVVKVVGPDGAKLPGQPAKCRQALRPEVANTAAYAMAGVMGGTARASNPGDGTPYIGKTGTTDASVHTWMVGASTAVSTAVWVGNTRGKQAMRNVYVNGIQASVLRHAIFRPVAQTLDALHPGSAMAPPDPALLMGVPTTVPDVVGLDPAAAEVALSDAELNMGLGDPVPSDQPKGTVARQSVAAGSSTAKGTEVVVQLSSGKRPRASRDDAESPRGATMPDVMGLSADVAVASLGDYDVGERCEPAGDPADPQLDTVVAQEPGAGAEVRPGQSVTITVRRATCARHH